MSHSFLNILNNSNSKINIFSLSENNFTKKTRHLFLDIKYRKNSNNNHKKLIQFILGKKLGKGAFATVRLATHIKTNELVAIKILEKKKLKENDKIRLNREIKILKKVRHRNIVNLYNVINSKNSIYLIMEYIKGTELFSYVNDKKRLNEAEACHYYQQIISGIEYLEKLKIVHRDIKLENIIIEDNKNVKIIDFGLSNIYPKNNILFSSCGSPCYASPEMIMGKNYSGSGTDIWSSGIVLFAMLCGYLPFTDVDEQKLYKKIMEGKIYFPQNISKLAKDLLKKLLNINPLKRININKIKEHPWFKLINPKITMSPGFFIDEIITPIDLKIIDFMVNKYGYNEKEIKIDLLKNNHNNTTTTYYILLDAKIKKGEKSIADMKSEEYLNYINNPQNLLSNYNYNIKRVIEERIFNNQNDEIYIDKKFNSYNSSPRNLSLKNNNIISLIKKYKEKNELKINTIKNNLQIKNKNLYADIDNNEEYLYYNNIDENIFNPTIPNENSHNKNNNYNAINYKLKEKKNRRNLSKTEINQKNILNTNTTYLNKQKISVFERKDNEENRKEKKITIINNINIINNNNFIKVKYENIINNLSKSKKPKRNQTLNNKNNTFSNSKIKVDNNNHNNSKIFKNKNSSKEKIEIFNNSLFNNEKIKVNSININNNQKIKNKKIIKKKTKSINFRNKTYLRASVTKNYSNENSEKNSFYNIRKNQTYKKQEKKNKENGANKKKLIKNENKSLKKILNINISNNIKEKKFYSKRLYAKIKNRNNLTLDKIESNKKGGSKYNIITDINKTNFNKEKESINNNEMLYNKMKTIDLKIKELGHNNIKYNKNNKKVISVNYLHKKIQGNKKIKEKAESVKERKNISEKIIKYNKRLNTDNKNKIGKFDLKPNYKTIKINKRRNVFKHESEMKRNNYIYNNTINNLIVKNKKGEENKKYLLRETGSFKENKFRLNKTYKNENKNNIISKKNNCNIKESKDCLPFDLNTIFIADNLENIFELMNNFLKINKIKFLKQKNKYICFTKENRFEIIITKVFGHNTLFLLNVDFKKSNKKFFNGFINNIINSISKL